MISVDMRVLIGLVAAGQGRLSSALPLVVRSTKPMLGGKFLLNLNLKLSGASAAISLPAHDTAFSSPLDGQGPVRPITARLLASLLS